MKSTKLVGYLPNDSPPPLQIVLLGFQHVLTMFPATVLVAALGRHHGRPQGGNQIQLRV